MNTIQKSLFVNAAFSSISGLILLAFSSEISTVFKVYSRIPFLIVGLGLILFSGLIVLAIKTQRAPLINSIIVQDGLWVIGSAWVLIFNPFDISPTGNWIITGVGLVVLALAIVQFWALLSKAKSL